MKVLLHEIGKPYVSFNVANGRKSRQIFLGLEGRLLAACCLSLRGQDHDFPYSGAGRLELPRFRTYFDR